MDCSSLNSISVCSSSIFWKGWFNQLITKYLYHPAVIIKQVCSIKDYGVEWRPQDSSKIGDFINFHNPSWYFILTILFILTEEGYWLEERGGEGSHPGTETEVSHFIAEKHQLHQEEKQLKRRGQEQPPHSDVCPLIISTLQRL